MAHIHRYLERGSKNKPRYRTHHRRSKARPSTGKQQQHSQLPTETSPSEVIEHHSPVDPSTKSKRSAGKKHVSRKRRGSYSSCGNPTAEESWKTERKQQPMALTLHSGSHLEGNFSEICSNHGESEAESATFSCGVVQVKNGSPMTGFQPPPNQNIEKIGKVDKVGDSSTALNGEEDTTGTANVPKSQVASPRSHSSMNKLLQPSVGQPVVESSQESSGSRINSQSDWQLQRLHLAALRLEQDQALESIASQARERLDQRLRAAVSMRHQRRIHRRLSAQSRQSRSLLSTSEVMSIPELELRSRHRRVRLGGDIHAVEQLDYGYQFQHRNTREQIEPFSESDRLAEEARTVFRETSSQHPANLQPFGVIIHGLEEKEIGQLPTELVRMHVFGGKLRKNGIWACLKQLLQLKVGDFSPSQENESCDCPVCLDSFVSGQRIVPLSCGHRFHEGCIKPWLRQRAQCPYCRMGV